MITATIKDISQQGAGIVVSVLFSNTANTNNPTVYTFGSSDTPVSISARIQADLDDMNARDYQLSTITDSLATGATFQTDPATLSALQANIDTQNTKAVASAVLTTGTVSAAP